MKKLENKIALITGAGRGTGRATAILFADHGARLILVARTEEELNETAETCRDRGVDVFAAACGLADRDRIDSLFYSLPDDFKAITILVNNAARFDAGKMHEYDYNDFEKMLAVNVLAPYYLARKIIPRMKSLGGGTIVNISSFSGCFGVEKFPGFGAYNITKYGLWGLTEILALENKDKNIRVNQLSPSGVDTKMFHTAVPPGIKADLQPDEVARHILYLAGDDSAPLTGENIMLSGMPGAEK